MNAVVEHVSGTAGSTAAYHRAGSVQQSGGAQHHFSTLLTQLTWNAEQPAGHNSQVLAQSGSQPGSFLSSGTAGRGSGLPLLSGSSTQAAQAVAPTLKSEPLPFLNWVGLSGFPVNAGRAEASCKPKPVAPGNVSVPAGGYAAAFPSRGTSAAGFEAENGTAQWELLSALSGDSAATVTFGRSLSTSSAPLAFTAQLTPNSAALNTAAPLSRVLALGNTQVDGTNLPATAATVVAAETADTAGDSGQQPARKESARVRSGAAEPTSPEPPAFDAMATVPDQRAKAGRESTPAATEKAAAAAPAEGKSEINQTPRPQPAREIALRLSSGESGGVDVRITERGGKVQVAVRTSDADLSRSLQSGLGELVGRLEKKGYSTETWTPQNADTKPLPGAREGSQTHSDASRSGRDEHPGQHGRHRNRPQWLESAEEESNTVQAQGVTQW